MFHQRPPGSEARAAVWLTLMLVGVGCGDDAVVDAMVGDSTVAEDARPDSFAVWDGPTDSDVGPGAPPGTPCDSDAECGFGRLCIDRAEGAIRRIGEP